MESKKEGEKSEFIPGFQNVDEFSQKGFKAVVEATRAFQVLPKKPSPVWDLRTTYPDFNRGLKQSRARIITSITKLLQHSKFSPHDFRKLDVEDKFDFIVDSNDELLERISTSLDQAEGLFKRAQTFVVNPNAPAAVSNNPPGTWKEKKLIRLNSAPATPSEAALSSSSFTTTTEQNTSCSNSSTPISNAEMARKIKKARYTNRVREKPQLKFTRPVDNSSSPFIPTLFDKPHSIKPLSILPEYNENNEEFYGHPYQIEINQWKPLEHMVEPSTPQLPPDMNQTPFLYVENPRDMEKMLAHLGDASEIAVDVEHHSYRSFLGITCLIQISTRTHDYVIDGLALRDQMHNLNEIFANPKILKVFHSANSDIEWLQKDYSVYVVGLFDTAIAAKLLNFSQISLQYLLSEICGTSTNKGFQLADWRIRPIPPEMLQYARMDTHFLLYIYDILKNRLIENGNEMDNLLNAMYERSRAVCLKRYEKPINNPQVALRKSRRSFNNRQLYCFTELFKWRDQVAREKDESLGYVLPNHMLLTMAESLPKEMTGIMACCDPVPPLVHSNVGLIHRIVLKARELPIHDVNETSMQNKSQKKGKEQKNWLLMMNSMYEVDLNEHGIENQSSSGFEGEFASDWWKSIDWSNLKSKNAPTISFNASRSLSKSNSTNNNNENNKSLKATPYQRYRITNEIMEKLRDPKKKEELDLENPIVKSVLETILVDPNAQENQDEEETRPTPAKKPLFDQEFVPFNPMSTPVKEKGKGKKRKRTNNNNDTSHEEEEKKPRLTENHNEHGDGEEEEVDDDNEVKPTVGILGIGDEDMPIILSDDDESEHNNIQYNNKKTPQKSNRSQDTPQNKKNRNKKRNKNLLKKLANRGKKRKYNVEEAEQEQQLGNEKSSLQNLEDGEIQEQDDDDNDVVEISPSNKSKQQQQYNNNNNKNQKKNFDNRQNNNKNNRGNNNKFDNSNGQSSQNSNNNSNNQSPRGGRGGKGGGNRGGKKKNFWNFNNPGKSITFK